MTRKRGILMAGAAVAVLAVFSLATRGSGVQVEVVTVSRDSLRVTVEEEGVTRVRDRFVIAAPVTGRLQRIRLDEGEGVSAGEIVARISTAPDDPRTRNVTRAQLDAAEARRRQMEAEVEQVLAQAAQAEREASRRAELAEAGALSREEMEHAQLQATTARRRAEAARAALRAAEADVEAMRASLQGGEEEAGPVVAVSAPASGRVLRVLERSERVVAAGTALLEVGDAEGLEVVVDVLSADAVRIRPGSAVSVEEWGGHRSLPARVRRVEPAAFTEISALGVEEQRVNVIVDLLDSPPELGAGYRVEASIVVWHDADVLTVPTSALFQRNGGWHLFTVEEGRARLRPVEIGQRGADAAQVLSGVEEGDEVIVFPSADVDDGVRVTTS